MELNVGKELAALGRMSVGQLQAKYAEVFGETTNGRHKQWLIKRIIWRMQALSEGDLSERAKQRAAELANDADLRRRPPQSPKARQPNVPAPSAKKLVLESDGRLPIPGSAITRSYKGQTLEVRVLQTGFEFEGEFYKSLSAVARHITGSHCNGYLFFRLTKEGGAR